MKEINGEAVTPVFNSGIWVKTAPGGTMLLDEAAGKKYFLNLTGSYILSKCNGEHTVAEIQKDVYEQFSPLSLEDATADVSYILQRLFECNILLTSKSVNQKTTESA